MDTLVSTPNPVVNERIEQAFNRDLALEYKKVETEANKAIGSFASFIERLSKLKEVSKGTEANKAIEKLTGELNNSSVFFAKMISQELSKIHQVVTPGDIDTPSMV